MSPAMDVPMAPNRAMQLQVADLLIKDMERMLKGTPVDIVQMHENLARYHDYRKLDPTSKER